MAFNPFNWFRKHQKVIFAGLTILCMIVFIFQFGAGDPFTKALGWFGAGRAAGDVVTTMYGKKVYEGDLTILERRRTIANQFILSAVSRGQEKARQSILEKELKSPGADSPLAGLDRVLQGIPERLNALRSRPQQQRELLQIFQMTINEDFKRLEEIATRDKVKEDPARLNVVERVARILGLQRWMMFEPAPQGMTQPLYFGGGTKLDDVLDFKLWLDQADALGIKLTDADVVKEIVAEAAGGEVFEGSDFANDPLVRAFMGTRDNASVPARELMEALRNEFRVVMAQGTLLGNEPGVRAYRTQLGTASSPAVATPDEFLNYVREQRANVRVQLLTIPVANYLAKVDGKPTPEELRLRYDRYKDQEPAPFLRDPGFKEPRRIAVEYVSGSPLDPYYRDVAKAKLFGWPATVALAGSPLGVLTLAGVGDPIRKEYNSEVKGETSWFDDPRDVGMSRNDRGNRFHFTSAVQPAGLASLFSSLSAGSPLAAWNSLGLNAGFVEAKTSVQYNLTQLLALSDPRHVLGAATLIVAATPPPASEALLQPQLIASIQDRIAEDELRGNITKIYQELQKLRGRAPAAKEFIAKAVKDYHLQFSRMPAPMTRDDLAAALKKKENVGLAGLRDAMVAGSRSERVDLMFANSLMQTVGTFEPRDEFAPEPRKEMFLWWRSEDLPARNRSYGQVESLVEQAWRTEKARQMARQEAERLEKKINDEKLNAALAEKVLKEQKQGPLFELDGVAQLNPPREVLAGRATEYRPYQVPEEKLEFVEYPSQDLAKQLLTLKRPGEATVVVDMPAKNFYVAVLMDRTEPTIADFKAIYAKTPLNDTLYREFLRQRRDDFRKAVMEQLRLEAVKKGGELDKDGRFKVAEAIRKRDSGSRSEDE